MSSIEIGGLHIAELNGLKRRVTARINELIRDLKSADRVTILDLPALEGEVAYTPVDRKPETVQGMFSRWEQRIGFEKRVHPMSLSGVSHDYAEETLALHPGHHIGYAYDLVSIVGLEIEDWLVGVPAISLDPEGLIRMTFDADEMSWTYDLEEFIKVMKAWMPKYVQIHYNRRPGTFPIIINPVGTDLYVVFAPRIGYQSDPDRAPECPDCFADMVDSDGWTCPDFDRDDHPLIRDDK